MYSFSTNCTWFMMDVFLPSRLPGKRMVLLLLPSSDSDLTTFSLSPFSFSCSFWRDFFLRLRRSLALLELSLETSEELRDKCPPPSSSNAASDTEAADVAIAAAWEVKTITHNKYRTCKTGKGVYVWQKDWDWPVSPPVAFWAVPA